MKKQISKCVKMLFLGIIMCLGMALSVHAEGSGQFFQFDGEKWNKEEFSWTDSQGQIWYAHEYGTNGEAIISAVTEATTGNTINILKMYLFIPGIISRLCINYNK